MSNKLLEQMQIVPGFAAVIADMDTDQTGDYVSMKGYGKCTVILAKAAGTAGDDPTLTLYEASDVSGTDAAALTVIGETWTKQAATSLAAVGTFTNASQTVASTVAMNATSAEQTAIIAFEIDAEQLSDGFDCIRVDVALAASGGAQYGCLLYLLSDPSYPQATPQSAIAN